MTYWCAMLPMPVSNVFKPASTNEALMSNKEQISESLIDLAADRLTGNIAAFLIDRLRDWECAYRYMDEKQQAEAIDAANTAAISLVRSVVQIIAADGKETIPVSVKKVVNNGEEIQVTIEASKYHEQRHALFDAAGSAAVLTVIDSEKYEGGDLPKPDPDQPELPSAQAAE